MTFLRDDDANDGTIDLDEAMEFGTILLELAESGELSNAAGDEEE